MAHPATRRPMTVEEYLAYEEASEVRHELVAGQVHALAGASRRHNIIVGNIYAALRAAARGGPCRVYVEAVKLRMPDDDIYYPDVLVVCDPTDTEALTVRRPCLLVEVTSDSTAVIDRREKLAAYRGLTGLGAYLIVDQERRHVERHWRDANGAWWTTEVSGEGSVPVPCPAIELTLAEIYENAG